MIKFRLGGSVLRNPRECFARHTSSSIGKRVGSRAGTSNEIGGRREEQLFRLSKARYGQATP